MKSFVERLLSESLSGRFGSVLSRCVLPKLDIDRSTGSPLFGKATVSQIVFGSFEFPHSEGKVIVLFIGKGKLIVRAGAPVAAENRSPGYPDDRFYFIDGRKSQLRLPSSPSGRDPPDSS